MTSTLHFSWRIYDLTFVKFLQYRGSKGKDQGFTEDVDIGDTYEEHNDLTLANEAEVDDDIIEDDVAVDGDESDPEDAEDLDDNLDA